MSRSAEGGGADRPTLLGAATRSHLSRSRRSASSPRPSDGSGPHGLTHLDREGRAKMVDVTAKPETAREARARATLRMRPATLAAIRAGGIAKGDVLGVARVAGIMAAKRTADLIPLCHPLRLTGVDVRFVLDRARSAVHVETAARTVDKTGVEMEALTAAAGAALAIYDMVKAIDRGMRLTDLRLVEKSGGRSGHWVGR
jgi:cyclic pyranopterin monophosphate synthase